MDVERLLVVMTDLSMRLEGKVSSVQRQRSCEHVNRLRMSEEGEGGDLVARGG